MTSERVQTALRDLGIGGTPLATLEKEDALFMLLEGLLIYQDAGGTRRVTLRDLNRIHSDGDGLLRVETPAGTALTASLLGFDPAEVQAFFPQVRDATARAKNLPSAPLPAAGGFKTFGTPPGPGPATRSPAPSAAADDRREANRRVTTVTATPSAVTPAPTAPAPTPTPERQREDAPVPTVSAPLVSAPPVEEFTAKPAASLAALPMLAERANAVHALVGRLRVLAVVLGLAAVGLALVQYLDGQAFQGLWTLIAGGVGSIALFVFADVTRLIVTLARAVAEQSGQSGQSGRTPDA
ncbi:hypothetical protein QOL99_11550 [Deinococcus sp. MIMF12]|uniref:DUF308 domain-containing protein n=1 Tax=Deinococcus rhizophilus TaxID=3049544 RepID=A0ABT7JJX0_9DEIO|nr:hypothetical protein [Deinococcus rhizophilus]MDL2344780.1 hypothetical protein [Deinococcus rhizophilus]